MTFCSIALAEDSAEVAAMKVRLARGLAVLCGFVLAISSPLRAQAQGAAAPPQQAAKPAPPSPTAQSSAPASPAISAQVATPEALPKYFQVASGTRLPLVLHNSVSTRWAHAGDPIYLETTFPILVDGHIVIPAGSYVSGEVTQAKRPGRIHGRGELQIRLDNLILPNGYQVSFNATPTDAGTGGNETVNGEGTIKGDTSKGQDAGTIIETTAAGAGLGGIAAGSREGAGIGAAAGAAAGLMAVLLTRGPEAELPRGTSLDVILNRPLYLLSAKANFKSTGQASTPAGPPNREPQRTRGLGIPFPY
jgi:hypothetical protein